MLDNFSSFLDKSIWLPYFEHDEDEDREAVDKLISELTLIVASILMKVDPISLKSAEVKIDQWIDECL